MSDFFELDGKIGGGSVLRVGIPLSIALNKPLHIDNVRHNRRRRGVQAQHMVGLNLLAEMTGSELSGVNVGSTEIFVTPGRKMIDPNYLPEISIPSSSAVSLVFQTFSNYLFAVKKAGGFAFNGGGSHVSFSPNFDVLQHVNAWLFEKFGLKTHIQLHRAGFYPAGGARGKFFMEPVPFDVVKLEADNLQEHLVISNASSALRGDKVAEKQITGYKRILTPDNTMFGYADSDSKGGTISSILRYANSVKSVAGVYESKTPAEDLGKMVADMARTEMANECSVDEQLADQLIVPLAFSPVGSSYTFDKMYPHIKTNIFVVEQMMGKILKVEEINIGFRIERI